MVAYLGRRLADLVVTVWGISTILFVVLRLSGEPVALMVTETTTPEQVAEIRHLLGFDEPLWKQYVRFLAQAATGDFGQSLRYFKPATALVLETLPATLGLTGAALAASAAVSLPLGILAAFRRGSWVDWLVGLFTVLGQAVPFYWLGIILMVVFAVWLRLLPSGGSGGPAHLVLPAATLAAYSASRLTQLVRAGVAEVLHEDYIRTARAKGLPERLVLLRHALKNALIPTVTVAGLQLGYLLGGSVVVETVFAWPGLGRLMVESVQFRDYTMVQGVVLVYAVGSLAVNLLVDLIYSALDPRIRYA
jgi:ABC-type dipeptide/oligopeptide/nickel transport system permease component